MRSLYFVLFLVQGNGERFTHVDLIEIIIKSFNGMLRAENSKTNHFIDR